VEPLRYAAAVEAALREKLGADEGYAGLICKNPLHNHWIVQVWETRSYTLDWLSDYLDLSPYNARRRIPDYGLGRNCNLFEKTRIWAYKAIRQGWPEFEQWKAAVLERALAYNAQFEAPLPVAEVKATAKSIAKWTHAHLSPAGFRAAQSSRGKRSGAVRRAGSVEEAQPWIELGICRATYYNRKKAGTI